MSMNAINALRRCFGRPTLGRAAIGRAALGRAAISRAAIGVLLLAATLLVLPRAHAAAPPSKPLNVVATTGMLADTLRAIGGDRIEVTALMGTGVDPHTYRQTRSDIQRMTRADLVVWHGLHLEAQLEKFFADLGKHRKVVALTEVIPEDKLAGWEDYPGRHDPHVWMDPGLWLYVVDAARDTLIEVDPDGADSYTKNAEVYSQQLKDTDEASRRALNLVPESARVLVTAHDAFGYFGRAYGYEVLGIQGISTESEASLNQIERLVSVLVDRKIKAIFVESSVADRNIRALVEGAAARGHKVVVGGELFSDAMGAPGTVEGTYIGMIQHNVETIARALSQ